MASPGRMCVARSLRRAGTNRPSSASFIPALEELRLARGGGGKELPPEPLPTLADFVDDPDGTVAPDEEISRLVGLCLWDVFSDGHDVLDEGGREISLGSFRASAGFLADRLNEQVKTGQVQGPAIDAATRAAEVQKVMGAAMPEVNNDLLFQFLKEHQTGPFDYMDFYLVDMRPLKERLDAQKAEESGEPDWAGYCPEKELVNEEADREKDRELARMRESLDEGYRESVAAALNGPPPLTVQSYREIFGEWPTGWPPTA